MAITKSNYTSLLQQIRQLVEQARHNVARSINTELLLTYWNVGRLIVEKEGADMYDERALRQMLLDISKELTRDLGKGFSRTNLFYMRSFFITFQGVQTVSEQGNSRSVQTVSERINNQKSLTPSGKSKVVLTVSGQRKKPEKAIGLKVSNQLSWSHYYELLKCNDEMEISFYQQTAINEGWSVRELRRQMDTALFERIALSKNTKGVMKLAAKGQIIESETDIAKDPYILEFLNIPEHYSYTEKHLEQKIIDNLQKFILELGKGFAFVARQFRITLNNTHYHVDLVFYHRILKCFVLIDLKIKAVEHNDIGQMNLYLNYFETEQNTEGDNQPIGIILSKYKDDVIVEYAIRGITNKIFVSKYQLYLPDKKLLKKKIKELLEK
ncbi:MAG: PDDEXK nuclease domain-containing protein [Bacteroidota bacterium]|nr:PDDEXK nuclease domain-containing protein [Bacteroidota bacterium]